MRIKILTVSENGWQAAAGSSIVNRLRMLTHLSAAASKKRAAAGLLRKKNKSAKRGNRDERSQTEQGIPS
jgi:hypothetical protein